LKTRNMGAIPRIKSFLSRKKIESNLTANGALTSEDWPGQAESKRLILLLVDVVGFSKMQSPRQLDVVRSLFGTWQSLVPKSCPDILGPPQAPISIGDGFIFAGTDSPQTVNFLLTFICSQVEAQAAVPNDSSYSSRFALHSGDCWLISDNIFGHPMNELARIASCAESGQVVASKTFWDRLDAHNDMTPDGLLFVPDSMLYDEYLVRYKHDKWFASGMQITLPQGDETQRAVRNTVIIGAAGMAASASAGIRRTPANSVKSTLVNNYHHDHVPNGLDYQLCSDEELYRLHCTEETQVMMVNTGSYVYRLPFVEEIMSRPGSPLIIREEPSPLTPHVTIPSSLVSLRQLSITTHDSETRVMLGRGRCSRQQLLVTNLSPDWCPTQGPHARAVSLRRALLSSPSLPPLREERLANATRVTAIPLSKDGRVVLTSGENGSSSGEFGTLGFPVSNFVSWDCTSEPTTEDEAAGRIADARLQELLWPRRKPISWDRHILHEIAVQMGLAATCVMEIHLLGVARNLRLLGLPEAFYLVVLSENYEDITRNLKTIDESLVSSEAEEAPLSLRGREFQLWADHVRAWIPGLPLQSHAKAGLAALATYIKQDIPGTQFGSILGTYMRDHW
jgi:hypothetical protein